VTLMKIKGYTMLGWLTWQGIKTVVKRKVSQDRVKLGAVATVLLVLVAGLAAAKAHSED
jgi:hypothetical protein